MFHQFIIATSIVLATVQEARSHGGLRCRNDLAYTPPMGLSTHFRYNSWMSWEVFRCTVDCTTYPTKCINSNLYKTIADAMVLNGFLEAGYNTVHIDDCWEAGRDLATNKLLANETRFPGGMEALADYLHAQGLKFGLYTAENTLTCGNYTGSALHEVLDAQTFADWGVDYLKVDGCGNETYYPTGYTAMGTALQITGRDIVYSCSWPAYLGSNETTKPFDTMIAIGCNLWRNWDDIQCSWDSLLSIIDHWGDYGDVLQQFAGPGHWNDPDMLLIGNDCITDDQARTQMAIWSLVAAPLIMGNDVRNISDSTRAILLNKDAIAINQDSLGKQGTRISPKGTLEVWSRELSDGSVAVGLLNKGSNDTSVTRGSFSDSVAIDRPIEWMKATVCNGICTANITVHFQDLGILGPATVFEIWTRKNLGVYTQSYSAAVPDGGTAFVKIIPTMF